MLEQKTARKQAEEALANTLQADKAKAADLRTAYQQHQDEVNRIKRDCERDIRRVVSQLTTTTTNHASTVACVRDERDMRISFSCEKGDEKVVRGNRERERERERE